MDDKHPSSRCFAQQCVPRLLTARDKLERLHASTVTNLATMYMKEQVGCAGTSAPRTMGVDEIATRKGTSLPGDRERSGAKPIDLDPGEGRAEADMDLIFAERGRSESARIRRTVMGMWRPFRNSVDKAPQAIGSVRRVHIRRYQSNAQDATRRSNTRQSRTRIAPPSKDSPTPWRSNQTTLTLDGARALKKLLSANKRLDTAYLMKDSFGQQWSYRIE